MWVPVINRNLNPLRSTLVLCVRARMCVHESEKSENWAIPEQGHITQPHFRPASKLLMAFEFLAVGSLLILLLPTNCLVFARCVIPAAKELMNHCASHTQTRTYDSNRSRIKRNTFMRHRKTFGSKAARRAEIIDVTSTDTQLRHSTEQQMENATIMGQL